LKSQLSRARGAESSIARAWEESDVTRMRNGIVELVIRNSGGHLAEFRFLERDGESSPNVLWESPWRFEKLHEAIPEDLAQTAGFTGHGLCLDNFGAPIAEQAAKGMVQHGEAARYYWTRSQWKSDSDAVSQWNVHLQIAQLDFERKIQLGENESAAYIDESVVNLRDEDHVCDWVEHATFGPSFVTNEDTVFAASGTRGLTAPDGYGEDSLVDHGAEFQWPFAPQLPPLDGVADLRIPFAAQGKGIVATVQMDPRRDVQYIVAVNRRYQLGVGYCFRRQDFPWMMVWEENKVRQERPWHGSAQARGMEFGSTPFPWGRDESMRHGRVFETPSWCTIPPNGSKSVRYVMFLFRMPNGPVEVNDVLLRQNAIEVVGADGQSLATIAARNCEEFLKGAL